MTDAAGRDLPSGGSAGGWQDAVIEAITPLTARVKSFLLRPARWCPFIAGQHLDIRLTAPDSYQVQRSYSVASAPEMQGVYELAIEVLDNGEVSPFFHEVAETGDSIEIRGPFGGHFNWSAEESGPVLLIGGGSGIVPLMSMARHRAARKANAPMALLYGARSLADAPYAVELLRLQQASDGFRLAFAFSREEAKRPGDFSGRINGGILREMLEGMETQPRVTFVCGANRFVETVTAHLVALGQPPASIRTERFGGE
jgi:ferredoxin-NADP reductase